MEALNDRYDVVDAVSRSGRVELLKAWDRDHDRFVALKVISPDKTMTRDQIVGEARVLLSLTPHRGLATVRYDFSAGPLCDRHGLDRRDGPGERACSRGDPGLSVPEAVNLLETGGCSP